MNFVARTAQREKSASLEERPWGAIGAVLRTFRSARQEAASLEAIALNMTLLEATDSPLSFRSNP